MFEDCDEKVAYRAASEAFEDKLKYLALSDFPCGFGSWRERPLKKSALPNFRVDRVAERFSITTRDHGAEYEMVESLQELLVSEQSPWMTDLRYPQYSWSRDICALRLDTVKHQQLLTSRRKLFNFFTDLRLTDCQITDCDEGMLVFHNLCSLNLSANQLKFVDSEHLPKALTILELSANSIEDLRPLCLCPPPRLQHLGLSYNKISCIDQHLTGLYWLSLISLDLSYNDLSDLETTVQSLDSLPLLQNLLLIGNPLSLLPVYRGYTVDSLPRLTYLDDLSVTIDERRSFSGMKWKLCDNNKVSMTIEIPIVKGIQMPEELKDPSSLPNYPKTFHKYFIRLSCVSEEQQQQQNMQLVEQQKLEQPELDKQQKQSQSRQESKVQLREEKEQNQKEQTMSKEEKKQSNKKVKQTKEQTTSEAVALDPHTDIRCTASCQQEIEISTESGMTTLCYLSTPLREWEKEMVLNWSTELTRSNVVSFRNFLLHGLDVYLVEEKIVFTLPESVVEEQVKQAEAETTKDSKKKGKPTIAAASQSSKKKGAGNKSKMAATVQDDIEPTESEPIYTTLAHLRLPLTTLLGHEKEITECLCMEWPQPYKHPESEEPANSVEIAKEESDSKKKKGKDFADNTQAKKDSGKASKKSGSKKKEEISKKSGGKKKEKVENNEADEIEPLKLYINVSLVHRLSAADADNYDYCGGKEQTIIAS